LLETGFINLTFWQQSRASREERVTQVYLNILIHDNAILHTQNNYKIVVSGSQKNASLNNSEGKYIS